MVYTTSYHGATHACAYAQSTRTYVRGSDLVRHRRGEDAWHGIRWPIATSSQKVDDSRAHAHRARGRAMQPAMPTSALLCLLGVSPRPQLVRYAGRRRRPPVIIRVTERRRKHTPLPAHERIHTLLACTRQGKARQLVTRISLHLQQEDRPIDRVVVGPASGPSV